MDHLLLHPHPSVVTTARHFVVEWSRQRDLPEDTVDTLELLTSEVVANAVVHGHGQVLISLVDGADPAAHPRSESGAPATGTGGGRGAGERVTVAVSDAVAGLPQVKALSAEGTGGRGLALVDLLAGAWGTSAPTARGTCHPPPPMADAGLGGVTGGKTTWFTLTT